MDQLRHPLTQEFPESHARIQELKNIDPDFASKAKEYEKLDHKLCGLEKNNVPTTDQNFEALKLRRVQLKDELYSRIRQ